MAILSVQRQATAFLLVVSIAVAAEDEVSQHPIPAVGPSLAQGALKFQGPARASEVHADPMDQFASLDDEFDDKATSVMTASEDAQAVGSSLAQGAMKFHGLTHPSEVLRLNPMADFAGLDDIFDQRAETVQAEDPEFSMLKLLANSSLYYTIALFIVGGLLLTSTWEHREPLQQQLQQRRVAQASMPKPAEPAAAVEKKVEASPAAAHTAAPSRPASVSVPRLDVAAAALKADAQPRVDVDALLAAADACRAGQAGSYANFCMLLAAQSDAH